MLPLRPHFIASPTPRHPHPPPAHARRRAHALRKTGQPVARARTHFATAKHTLLAGALHSYLLILHTYSTLRPRPVTPASASNQHRRVTRLAALLPDVAGRRRRLPRLDRQRRGLGIDRAPGVIVDSNNIHRRPRGSLLDPLPLHQVAPELEILEGLVTARRGGAGKG